MTVIARRAMVVGVLACACCVGSIRQSETDEGPLVDVPPTEGCREAWSREAARAFVSILEEATASSASVWEGYDLADGTYVLHAGSTTSGAACLGAWRGGKTLDFAELPDAPRLSTPLYGYLLPEGDYEGFGSSLGSQPPSVRDWLSDLGVHRATILPVEVPDFPIRLSPLVKVQLAIHEGFHVEVQSSHWAGGEARWPVWDRQPDRPGVVSCYAGSPAMEVAVTPEQDALLEHVQALLDGNVPRACSAGADFLARRAARRNLVAGIAVLRNDGTPGTCEEAEAIMELEEGAADYASWTQLFEAGLATRDRLIERYSARQDDMYYLTGAMQLHAISLMAPDRLLSVIGEIARSGAPGEASLEAIFARTLGTYCGG